MQQQKNKLILAGCILLLMLAGIQVNAQQKPSERSFSNEVTKINKLRSERKAYAARHIPALKDQHIPAGQSPMQPFLTAPQLRPSARPVLLPAKPKQN
jgi:hypothetical protein